MKQFGVPSTAAASSCSNRLVAISLTVPEPNISIWRLDGFFDEEHEAPPPDLVLSALSAPIETLVFSKQNLLLSVAPDQVAIWDFSETSNGELNGYIISDITEYVSRKAEDITNDFINSAVFSENDQYLAICVDNKIKVFCFEYPDVSLHVTFDSHKCKVNDCSFSRLHHDVLVSVSDDCTCKVWDIENKCIIFSTSALAEELVKITADPSIDRFVVGTSSCTVIFFNLEQNSISKQRKLREMRTTALTNSNKDCSDGDLENSRIVQMEFVKSHIERNTTLQNSAVAFDYVLTVSTSRRMFLIQPKTYRIMDNLDDDEELFRGLGIAESVTLFPPDVKRNSLRALVCCAFVPVIGLYEAEPFGLFSNGEKVFSIFPSDDPPIGSPLRHEGTSIKIKSKIQPTSVKKSRIKSSGYGKAPVMRMFSGTTGKAKQPLKRRDPRRKGPVGAALSNRKGLNRSYPCDCDIIRHFQNKHITEKTAGTRMKGPLIHQGAIHTIRFSSDASILVTGSQDNSARITKLPVSRFKGEGDVFNGHEGAVLHVDISHSRDQFSANEKRQTKNHLLLTSSEDGTTKMWKTGRSTHLLSFSNTKSPETSHCKKSSYVSRFYYMDKFVLRASEGSLLLHSYNIDNYSSTELCQRESFGTSEICQRWQIDNNAHIKCFTAANSFLSNIILVGNSTNVCVIDAAADTVTRIIENAHERQVHSIALPTSSMYTPLPPSAHDIFLTSSTDFGGTLNLWDLRERTCVQAFTGHVNNSQSLGLAFSPCLRYVATGSEDNSCYLYDIRTGTVLERLRKHHHDTVSDVAFNPLHPQLATATFDGRVHFFADKI